eukprot:maker-scaffold5_size1054832-snap-gene-5.7 protein:Tk04040 transcript:maker-scaffold5_size1054832-snap-gene-5.7-mRNA-1 annotation:"Protein of unknown function DUF2838"
MFHWDAGQDHPKGFVSTLREGVSNNVRHVYNKSKGQLFHVIAGPNKIIQFRIGDNNKLILENTVKSIQVHTERLRQARQRLIDAGKQVPKRAQERVRGVITGDPKKRIRDHMKEAPQVRLMDKVSFTLAVMIIIFTEFIMLKCPEWFQPFYLCFIPLLFAVRFAKFRGQKYQWFRLDFCYLVNISCMIQSQYYPDDFYWFSMNFAASVGPLAASIVVWKNSLVFHCADKLTSFFLHAFPALLCHHLRWDSIPSNARYELESMSFWTFYLSAVGLYIGWQFSYLFITEWAFKSMLDSDPQLSTSLQYLAADKKNPLTRMVQKVSKQLKFLDPHEELDAGKFSTKMIFVCTQVLYTSVTLIPAYFVFKNASLCEIYLVAMFIWSTWNGASYYIEVFSKRYNLKFEAKSSEKELENKFADEDIFMDTVEDLALSQSQTLELIQILESSGPEKRSSGGLEDMAEDHSLLDTPSLSVPASLPSRDAVRAQEGQTLSSSPRGQLVSDVRDAVDHFRREMSENVKEAFNRSTDRLYHVITSNNRIVQFRVGDNGKLILEKTIQSLNIQTNKLKEARTKIINAGKQVPEKTKKQMREVITGDPNKRIRDHLKEEPQVKMIDKFSFTLGVLVITFTEYIIMRHPDWFKMYYHLLMTFLFVLRYVTYKESKFQFFMLDFCYLVNFSCMFQTFFYPDNTTWFVANFAASMGPLATAIVVWRNSLVFHDLDKVTSFFLHAFPPLLCHLLRWGLIPCTAVKEDTTIDFGLYFFSAVGIYIGWQISYLLATEYLFKPQLDADPELTTSLRYLSQDKKNPARKLVKNVCVKINVLRKDEELDPDTWKTKIIFVVSQLAYTIFTLLPPYFIFMNYRVSAVYLITIFTWATWNGASYYVEVFSKRYNLKFGQEVVAKDEIVGKMSDDSSEQSKPDESAEDDEDVFVDSLENLNLNESQAMELIDILEKLESKTEDHGGNGSSEDGSDIVKLSTSDLDEKDEEGVDDTVAKDGKKDV